MKVVNKTHFETRDLKRIFMECARLILRDEKVKHVTVTAVYARQRRGASGCAYIGGTSATVRINKHEPKPASVAAVTVHEFRHLNGWSHKEMKGTYNGEQDRYAWANDMGIRVRASKPVAKPGAETKHAHALIMLVRAESRLKRATTIHKKWKYKVRYHERRMAAVAAGVSK